MASIHREIEIAARPDAVWDALRDVGAIHKRLAPGFVTDVRLEPGPSGGAALAVSFPGVRTPRDASRLAGNLEQLPIRVRQRRIGPRPFASSAGSDLSHTVDHHVFELLVSLRCGPLLEMTANRD